MINMDLTIVVPSYNEYENLQILLPQIEAELANFDIIYEVLIIDKIEVCLETQILCSNFKYVKYINRVPTNSYGDAIRTGINKCLGDFLIFMDADGSHTPSFIRDLFSGKNNFDIIIASRYVDGGKTDNGIFLIFMSFVVNKLYSLVLNLKVKDVSNSFKLYKSNHLKELYLECVNFDIVEEILYKCKINNPNLKILELPYTFKKRLYGKTKRNLILFIFTFIITLFKLRLSKNKTKCLY